MKNERIKFFRKYINDNIDSWCISQDLEWSIDDVINFSIFLLYDSKMIKSRNKLNKLYCPSMEKAILKLKKYYENPNL